MALIMRASASGGLVHIGKPGLYDAVVSQVRTDQMTSSFGTNDVVRFTCKLDLVVDEGGDPVHLDAIANARLTPQTKLWAWLEALGLHPEVDFDIDIEQAVGKACVLSIVDAVREGTTFSRVDAMYPPKRQQLAAEGLVTPTGGLNYTAFWAECGRRHITREMVADYLGGDINSIGVLPINDVLRILEELRGI